MHFRITAKHFWGIELKSINVCLGIDFFEQEQVNTNYIYSDANPLWVLNKKFDVIFHGMEDCFKKITISLINEKKKVIGRIQIPFFQLAKGTYLNNFPFNSWKLYQGRLEFEIKIS